MANDVIFVKQQGGLGRPLAGEDFISGLLFYSDATYPTGFSSSNKCNAVFSIQEAEALGILNTSLGETKAVAKLTIAGTPAIGDTLVINYTGIDGLVNVLPSYALVSGEQTSVTTAAAAWVTKINAGTSVHGFSATSALGVILITTKAGEGVFPNTGTPYTSTVTGGSTATWVQPIGTGSTVLGVESDIDVLYYHVSEFFRIQPKGKLFIGFYPTSDATTFASIALMQNIALGKIRQFGVYQKTTTFATTQVTALQAVVDAQAILHKPFEVIYQGKMTSATTLAALSDLRALAASNVSVVMGQDGANKGYKLFQSHAYSIGILGTTLGAIAFAKVSDDIAWIAKFNVSNVEFDTLAYANGVLYSAQTDAVNNNVNTLGYIALKKFDIEGSYFNDSHTCTPIAGDFAYIENNRTYNKAIRNLRVALLPQLASPLKVKSDGTLSEDTIGYFQSLCDRSLGDMQKNNELSAYGVVIDPSQNVLSSSELVISVSLVPIGVARKITVNVGFKLSI